MKLLFNKQTQFVPLETTQSSHTALGTRCVVDVFRCAEIKKMQSEHLFTQVDGADGIRSAGGEDEVSRWLMKTSDEDFDGLSGSELGFKRVK